MEKFKKYPFVAIKWKDHSGDGGWIEGVPDDADLTVAYTIGWLLDETEEAYHVINTQTINPAGEGGLSTILKCCVTDYKVLRKKL